MNNFRVHPFHLQDRPDGPLLVTSRRIIELASPPLASFLRWLADDSAAGTRPHIVRARLEAQLLSQGLSVDSALAFLTSHGVLQDLGLLGTRLSCLTVFSRGEPIAAEFESQCREVLPLMLRHLSLPSDLNAASTPPPHEGGGPELCLLLLEDYDEPSAQAFHRCLRQIPEAAGLVVWFRLRALCISTLYVPSQGTPCHFCDMGWEGRARAKTPGTQALAKLLGGFEGSNSRAPGARLLRPADRTVAAAYLVHLVENLTALSPQPLLQDAVTVRRELLIDGLSMTQLASAHWPGCDCQFQFLAGPSE